MCINKLKTGTLNFEGKQATQCNNKLSENQRKLAGYVCCETRAVLSVDPVHLTHHRLPVVSSVHLFIGERQRGVTVAP